MGTPWRSGLCVGPPGLEPRMTEPKPVVLPITPWSSTYEAFCRASTVLNILACTKGDGQKNAVAKVRQKIRN